MKQWIYRRRVSLSFVALVVVGSFVLTGFGIQIDINSHQNTRNREFAQEGKEAHDAICALRSNLRASLIKQKADLKNAEEFLKEHPHGIPGISRKILQSSITDQATSIARMSKTITSLNKVKNCGTANKNLTSYEIALVLGN